MKFCAKCGGQLSDESKFCKYCGSPQPERVQNNQEPQTSQLPVSAPVYSEPKKSSNKGLIIGLIVASLLLLSLIGTFLVLTQKGIIDIGGSSTASDSSTKKTSKNKKNKSSKTDDDDDDEDEADDADADDEDTDDADTEEVTEEVDLTTYDGIESVMAEKTPMNVEFISSDVTDYPTVKVYYTVEDDQGVALTLDSPNVAIKEKCANGTEVERKIVSIEPLKGNQGVSFNICADKSGSMEDSMSTMQSAMASFVDAMDTNSGDKAELISFDTYIMYMCTYTQDKTLLKNGINNMVADGGTLVTHLVHQSSLHLALVKREVARPLTEVA